VNIIPVFIKVNEREIKIYAHSQNFNVVKTSLSCDSLSVNIFSFLILEAMP